VAIVACWLPSGCGRAAGQVWFAPNLGSPDMVELFTRPQQWSTAREHIDTFKFYEQHLLSRLPAECPDCGPNLLPAFEQTQAFARLAGWGIAVAVEVAAIKGHTCSPEANAALALTAIRNVRAGGGNVRHLAMDEPLIGGAECAFDLEQTAGDVAAFCRRVQDAEPAVAIGDIEPYPAFTAPALEAWLAALRREGVTLSFFHLDVDRGRAERTGADLRSDLRALQRSAEEQGIPFGVIFWGADRTEAGAYAADVLAWAETVGRDIGVPAHSVFQSWSRTADGRAVVPRNLPETASETMTHTRLLNEGLRVLHGKAAAR
jgi:hypothetical protein